VQTAAGFCPFQTRETGEGTNAEALTHTHTHTPLSLCRTLTHTHTHTHTRVRVRAIDWTRARFSHSKPTPFFLLLRLRFRRFLKPGGASGGGSDGAAREGGEGEGDLGGEDSHHSMHSNMFLDEMLLHGGALFQSSLCVFTPFPSIHNRRPVSRGPACPGTHRSAPTMP